MKESRRHPERLKFAKRICRRFIMSFPLYKEWHEDRLHIAVAKLNQALEHVPEELVEEERARAMTDTQI